MRRIRLFTSMALAAALSSGSTAALGAPQAPAPALPETAEVAAVIASYVRAREARDPQAIAALFASDADQLVSSGEWRRGRDAVVKGTLASSAATGGTRSIMVETVRRLSPDVAIVDGRYEISGLAGGATRRMWTSFVLVRQDGTWRITAIRNMLPGK